MNIKTSIIDFLAQPALLPLRERARAVRNVATGTASRVKMRLRSTQVPGMLSIVVPMYNVEGYIGECIESLLKQNYPNVQIVIVDDGSPDGSYDVARRYARRDPRVQIVRQPNGGLSAARNTGIAHARGEFLAFLDSDDFVDRHCYADAMAALAASGSDFAVLPYRRERNGTFPVAAPWIQLAHQTERLGTNLKEFPDIMVNAVAWSKVYRRDFWDSLGREFPVGLLYEDQAISMAVFAEAKSFDVLSRVSLNWRIRGDQSSITQQVTSARNIADHAIAVRDSFAALEQAGQHEAARVRVVQIMNNNLGEFLPSIRQMDEAGWGEFVSFLDLLRSHADADIWAQIEMRKKVMIGLCVAGEKDLALRFLEADGWERDHFGGHVTGSTLVAELPLQEELAAALPAGAFLFAESETALCAFVRRITRVGDTCEIDAIAYIDHLRMDVEDTQTDVCLISPSGVKTELAVTRRSDAWAVFGHTRRYADMAPSALTVSVPFESLSECGSWVIEVTMRCGEVVRSDRMRIDERTSFTPPEPCGNGSYFALESDDSGYANWQVTRPAVVLADVQTQGSLATCEVRSELRITELALVRRDDRFAQRRAVAQVGGAQNAAMATIELPRTRGAESAAIDYRLIAIDATGAEHDPVLADQTSRYTGRAYVKAHQHAETQQAGGVTLTDLNGSVFVKAVSVVEDQLRFAVGTDHLSARLASGSATTGSTSYPLQQAAGSELALDLVQDPWGLGPAGVKSGKYTQQALLLDGTAASFTFASSFERMAPYCIDDVHGRFVFELEPQHTQTEVASAIRVTIEPPLRDTERGGGYQWRLRDWCATLTPSGKRSVLFRNLYGESANDSALAVHRELQRRGSELDLIWAVQDESVWVPDGAKRVLENSTEFYEAFGTANYVMVNVHQPFWYRKPAGQVLIETFHGYPFKLNGRRWWQRLGFTVERQESFFKRAEEWDYLVSPARYATPVLEEFYREGADPATEFLEIGYPRNDALLDVQAAEVRDRTRAALGIPAGKQAILYAPTFRDYLSGDDMTAELVELLDLERLMSDLGDDYVLLLRGHPFNARAGTERSDAFINVTDYPDINHLILASDIGVLDYSSLRFDYALTGRPNLYYVPDLERYFDGREGFAPYADTSPGPHLRTHDDLVAAVRNADQVALEYEQARQRFIATYMELEDGHAAARLVDRVFVPRGDAKPLDIEPPPHV